MPVPKRKHSKGRTRRKRFEKVSLSAPQTVACKSCGEQKMAHRVCESCGN